MKENIEASKKQNNPQKHYCKVIYLDCDNKRQEKNIEMPGYRENQPYKANVEEAWFDITENLGLWIDDETIIPMHRILAIKTITTPKNPPPKAINRSRRHHRRRQKPAVQKNSDNSSLQK